jgi:predicted RNA-binding protein
MQTPRNKALITQTTILTPTREDKMCEFNVILNGKTQFKDVVYAKTENNNVTVKNILGETKEFKNCKITEVDVNSTRLVLTAIKP